MSNTITLEGKEYVPATYAGRHFGYSKDYLLLLVKNGKIDGQKVGNKWYVNIPSAEVHFAFAEKERAQKRKQLSIERKLELLDRDAVVNHEMHRRRAILETLVIVVIGLSIGATSYLGTSSQVSSVAQSDVSFFENLAVALYRFVSGTEEMVVVKIEQPTTNSVSTSTLVERGQNDNESDVSFVIAPSERFSSHSVDALRKSFSDEVEVSVDPMYPDTGIVIPRFQNTEGESYRFLMVPISHSSDESPP